MNELLIGFYSLISIAAIVGAFKAIDWLISLKYRTKDDCMKCQSAIKAEAQSNRDILICLDTKMDLILKHSKIIIEE
jgi:hypothetical protein